MNWRDRLWAIAKEVHRHADTYFGYLVAASIALQSSWAELDEYVPPQWRHGIIGAAVVIVWLDRTRRAVRDTRP